MWSERDPISRQTTEIEPLNVESYASTNAPLKKSDRADRFPLQWSYTPQAKFQLQRTSTAQFYSRD